MPPEEAQAPMEMAHLGCGIWSQIRRITGASLKGSRPAQISTSAWRGEKLCRSMPKRAMSNRLGMERQSFSPRQADVLICAGRLPFKLAPVIRRIWDQMPQPKWSISMGACASSGGIFDNYSMVQGIDTIIPVDVYVPGCPPRPEGLMYGILLLQKKIKGETIADDSLRQEHLVGPSGLFLPPEKVDELSEPFGNSVSQTRSA